LAWTINYTVSAKQQLKKLDKQVAKRIRDYMADRIAKLDDPRSVGKALTGNLGIFWRYRVGDYRLICDITDDQLIVLVVRVAHRKQVYE
jgi:mRNA interferase RelE/StbE